jgi:hypothetical protein
MTAPLLPVFMNAWPYAKRTPATPKQAFEAIVEHALAVHGYEHTDDAHLVARTAVRSFAHQLLAIVDAEADFLSGTYEHRYSDADKRRHVAAGSAISQMRELFATTEEIKAERELVAGPPPTDAEHDADRAAEEREALAQAQRDGQAEAA